MKYLFIIFIILGNIFWVFSCKKSERIIFCNQNLNLDETMLICINKGKVDLTPLYKFKNLVTLDLTGSNIKSFKPLKKIENLKYLSLKETNLLNGNSLKNLENLEILILDSTEIKNISFVKTLKNLKYLSLKGVNVKLNPIIKFLSKGGFYLEVDDFDVKQKIFDNYFTYREIKKTGFRYYCPKKENIIITNNESALKKYLIKIPNNYSLQKYKLFSKCTELLISLEDKSEEEISFNILGDGNFVKFKNINALARFKNLKLLKIYVTSDNYMRVISSLSNLKTLYLILGKEVKRLPCLPNKLENLFIYSDSIDDIKSIRNYRVENINLIVKDFRNKKYLKLNKENTYSNINILDFYLNSERIFRDSFESSINDIDSEHFYIKNAFKSRSDISEKYKHIELPNDFRYQSLLWEFQNYLRNLIHYKEIDGIILTNNKEFIIHILKNYEFDLNQIDEYKQTLLDRVIGIVDNDIISILRKHDAKRGCEILKTKCKALSPEIEKILKNNNKTKGDK